MSIADKLRAELGVLIVIAPEYGRISRQYWRQYEATRSDGKSLVQAMEYHFREQMALEKINWINEMLREEK